jgi:hypothetical protein
VIDVVVATEILAPAETVWRVLTDLDRYHEWNPFIRRARGSIRRGGRVKVRVKSRARIPLRFAATVTGVEDRRWFEWRGTLGPAWLACGDHRFEIEPIDARRVRLIQHERLDGAVSHVLPRLLEREIRTGFLAMNRALAARAEGLSSK